MSNLKEKIQEEFIGALKSKNLVKKSALSMLKSKITEEEKKNKNLPLNESQIIKVVAASVKQRRQAIEEFQKGGRLDLVDQERGELQILETLLPPQMEGEVLETALMEIVIQFPKDTPRVRKMGMSIGAFNKKYPGQADPQKITEILEKIIPA
jgi:uncharacterized protein